MPPKAARESSRVKPKVGIVAGNGQGAHQVYLSRIAGFVFLSFFRRLRKDERKSNRSSKSCRIRKRGLRSELLRSCPWEWENR